MKPEEYFLEYNKDNIFKNLIQCEDHLKNLNEPGFNQCALKHLLFVEGELEEAVTHSLVVIPEKHDKYKSLVSKVRDIRKEVQEGNADPKKTSMQVRNLRRDFEKFNKDFDTAECKACGDTIKNISKDLNSKATFNNDTHSSFGPIKDYDQLNGENENMTKYTELMYMNAGQFAAEGLKYLAETNATLMPHEKWVKIGGGLGLQMLGLFIKMPKALKDVSIVAGSNLLASGVIMMVRGGTTGVARAGVSLAGQGTGNAGVGKFTGRPNGRVFSGPVTATNIPSEYARSGILAGAQAFEDPAHAGMIRVD